MRSRAIDDEVVAAVLSEWHRYIQASVGEDEHHCEGRSISDELGVLAHSDPSIVVKSDNMVIHPLAG